jgi:polysaccharide export outer membrane protein
MLREMCNAAKWTAVSAGAFLLAQPFAYAQQMPPLPAPVLQQTTTPTLQQNPQIAMREFEPAENQEYELGRGDAISIDFAGRPEMSSKQIVGPDGRITLPMAGALVVADKTREQAAQAIVAALTPFYEHLNVTVGVDKYTSNQVLLLGAVEHPGVLTFDRPPTLLEVVSRGGAIGGVRNAGYNTNGFAMQANLQPMGSGVPERCAIYRGADKVIWVDLKKLLDSGSALADLRLKRDDIVYVPSSAERYISVLGQVQHPGALQLDDNMTLAKLLSLSGGFTPEAGKNPQIMIVQQATGQKRTISFNQILKPGPMDLTLHSGDIVYVPKSGFNNVAYVFDKLSPLVSMFTASALIGH